MTKLTRNQLLMLRDLSPQPFSAVVTTGRAYVAVCESLVKLGLVSAHRSSIGEIDERATYSITEEGREALADTLALDGFLARARDCEVEVIVHAAEPDKLPRRKGISTNTINGRSKKVPGDVAIYGRHADVIKYVASVWGVDDRDWFDENVIVRARVFLSSEARTVLRDNDGETVCANGPTGALACDELARAGFIVVRDREESTHKLTAAGREHLRFLGPGAE